MTRRAAPHLQIPAWLRWAQYTCALKYCIDLFAGIEFSEPVCGGSRRAECDALMEANGVDPDLW